MPHRFFQPSPDFVDWLARYARGRIVVEVGCGDAHLLRELMKRGVSCVGIEPNFYQLWAVDRTPMHVKTRDGELVPLLVTPKSAVGHEILADRTKDILAISARPGCIGSDWLRETVKASAGEIEWLYIGKPSSMERDLGEQSGTWHRELLGAEELEQPELELEALYRHCDGPWTGDAGLDGERVWRVLYNRHGYELGVYWLLRWGDVDEPEFQNTCWMRKAHREEDWHWGGDVTHCPIYDYEVLQVRRHFHEGHLPRLETSSWRSLVSDQVRSSEASGWLAPNGALLRADYRHHLGYLNTVLWGIDEGDLCGSGLRDNGDTGLGWFKVARDRTSRGERVSYTAGSWEAKPTEAQLRTLTALGADTEYEEAWRPGSEPATHDSSLAEQVIRLAERELQISREAFFPGGEG